MRSPLLQLRFLSRPMRSLRCDLNRSSMENSRWVEELRLSIHVHKQQVPTRIRYSIKPRDSRNPNWKIIKKGILLSMGTSRDYEHWLWVFEQMGVRVRWSYCLDKDEPWRSKSGDIPWVLFSALDRNVPRWVQVPRRRDCRLPGTGHQRLDHLRSTQKIPKTRWNVQYNRPSYAKR